MMPMSWRLRCALFFAAACLVLSCNAQTLRKGDKGQNVGAIQFLLRFRGMPGVKADLVFSDNTVSSVRRFQEQANLPEDGVMGPSTLQKLFAGVLIRAQSSGDDVRALQTLVCVRDGGKCTRTATMDAKTIDAVKVYQKSKGLPADGIVGDRTWAALFGVSLAPPPPPPTQPARTPVAAPRNPPTASPVVKPPTSVATPPPKQIVPTDSHYDFIKKHEGFRSCVYKDVAKLPTICWGHLITKAEASKYPAGTCLSQSICMDILRKDVAIAASCISNNVQVPLTCNQYGAKLSFIFNLGCSAYKSSGFFRNTNSRKFKAAGDNMLLWNKAGKPPKVWEGLVSRRKDEVALWSRTDSTRCFP